jgi:hypothetical protein
MPGRQLIKALIFAALSSAGFSAALLGAIIGVANGDMGTGGLWFGTILFFGLPTALLASCLIGLPVHFLMQARTSPLPGPILALAS